jgi:adenosylcobinamide-phosphate guanylyltransferase
MDLKVPALVMAGGKGKRMGALPIEKPLLPCLGKPLVDWVCEAVAGAGKVSEFFVVTSSNTPETEKHCSERGWKVLRTDAQGYHEDLKQAVRLAGLQGPVLTIPADLPAVTGRFLDKVVDAFEGCGKDFLAVFVPIVVRERLGLSVSSTDEFQGVWHAVSGVNIVDAHKTRSNEKIETDAIITEEVEVLLNVNTMKDLEIAEKLMQEETKS